MSEHEPAKTQTKKKSRRISKDNTEDYWIDFGKRHPDKWKELHYLRETIQGRNMELKMLKLKLKQKTARYLSIATPESKNLK